MPDRKARNREIERMKKTRQTIVNCIVAAIAALVVGALVWVVWDVQNRRTVMSFEGERIATAELDFFDINFSDWDIRTPEGYDVIMGALKDSLAVLSRAQLHGITLTEEEQAIVLNNAREFSEWTGFTALSIDRMAEFFSIWPFLRPQLADIYLPPTTEIDQDEFEDFIEFAKATAYVDWVTMETRQLALFNPEEDLDRVLAAIGTPQFDALIEEFVFDFFGQVENPELMHPVELMDQLSIHFGFSDENISALIALQEGDYEVFELEDVTFVVYMQTRSILQEEMDLLEEIFIDTIRSEALQVIIEGWVEATDFTVNNRVRRRL